LQDSDNLLSGEGGSKGKKERTNERTSKSTKWNFPYWEFNTITWIRSSNGLETFRRRRRNPNSRGSVDTRYPTTDSRTKLIDPRRRILSGKRIPTPNQTRGGTLATYNPLNDESDGQQIWRQVKIMTHEETRKPRVKNSKHGDDLTVMQIMVLQSRMRQNLAKRHQLEIEISNKCSRFSLSESFFQ